VRAPGSRCRNYEAAGATRRLVLLLRSHKKFVPEVEPCISIYSERDESLASVTGLGYIVFTFKFSNPGEPQSENACGFSFATCQIHASGVFQLASHLCLDNLSSRHPRFSQVPWVLTELHREPRPWTPCGRGFSFLALSMPHQSAGAAGWQSRQRLRSEPGAGTLPAAGVEKLADRIAGRVVPELHRQTRCMTERGVHNDSGPKNFRPWARPLPVRWIRKVGGQISGLSSFPHRRIEVCTTRHSADRQSSPLCTADQKCG
jgi:hypothetical protein